MTFDHFKNVGKYLGDTLSFGVAVGTLVQILPAIAALFTILWIVSRWTESETGRAVIYRLTGFDIAEWRKIKPYDPEGD